MANKPFEIGDLVRYNTVIPSYLPAVLSDELGVVIQVGAVDVRVYSMTQKKKITVRGTSCKLLSRVRGIPEQ